MKISRATETQRTPLGVGILSSCAILLGFALSAYGINSFLKEFEYSDLVFFVFGLAYFLAGIDFYRLRKWAWCLAAVTIVPLAVWVCSFAVGCLMHRQNVKEASLFSALLFLCCYPFLVYYLVRSKTRSLFGIGLPTKKG